MNLLMKGMSLSRNVGMLISFYCVNSRVGEQAAVGVGEEVQAEVEGLCSIQLYIWCIFIQPSFSRLVLPDDSKDETQSCNHVFLLISLHNNIKLRFKTLSTLLKFMQFL